MAGQLLGVHTVATVRRTVVGRVRRDLVLATALVMAHQALEVIIPVLIGVVIDRGVATRDGTALVTWLGALALVFVGLSAAGCFGIYVFERLIMRSEHEARMIIATRALDAGGGTEAVARPGELVSLASLDSARVGEAVGGAVSAAGALAGTVVAGGVLLATSLELGLVILIGVPVVLLVIRGLARPVERRSADQHEAVASAAGTAADLLDGLRVLKGLGAETTAVDRYRAASRLALVGSLRSARIRGVYQGATIGLSGTVLIVVAWLGGRLAAEGTISIGELVAAVGLTQFLIGPLTNAAVAGAELARGRGSARRIAEILDAPPAAAGGDAQAPVPAVGAVRITGLRAGSLDGFDLAVTPGEHVGVVAVDPNDATALVAVLGRERDLEAGSVDVDGRPLAGLPLEDARALVLAAAHDATLFEGSIADNLGSGPERDAALVASATEEMVRSLPGGLAADVGADGRNLSGGQRQRLMLARALAAQAPVLVLHEPTTAVDAATEDQIAAGVRALRDGRTTILVTSSPALLATTDRVVLVEQGHVVREARHEEFASTDADYRALVLA